MKKLILASELLVSSLVSLTAYAQPRPGSPLKHQLACQFVQPIAGVGYGLLVTTQALAPQYNVRGISLLKQVVYPGAPVEEAKLKQLSQDAEMASFVSEDGVARVDFEKSTFTGAIYFDGKLTLTCKK